MTDLLFVHHIVNGIIKSWSIGSIPRNTLARVDIIIARVAPRYISRIRFNRLPATPTSQALLFICTPLSTIYLFRIGKTGRFGSKGVALTFYDGHEDIERLDDIIEYHDIAKDVKELSGVEHLKTVLKELKDLQD